MALLLVLVTGTTYWPVTTHDFLTYDDPAYVTDNVQVQAGLTWHGLAWAFGRLHGEETYWHPLTWVSHMQDCQLFGLKPAGHHLVNLLFHTLNTVLVFLVFWRMTHAFWRCAVLAALFALHPLQVDTVAWVAERKNLLGAFFWLLTTWGYTAYVEARGSNAEGGMQHAESGIPCLASSHAHYAPRGKAATLIFYLLSLSCFALGLMCKPVLVTLPFVLLLLDYWPLGRLTTHEPPLKNLISLVWEKIPFFALATVSSLVTVLAHRSLGALETAFQLPLGLRIENAVVSYVRYLGKAIWPTNLAVFYPYPDGWPVPQIIFCGLLLVVVSGLVARVARTGRYLLLGWFWFLGVLIPFIGLIQAGAQAMADRFAYLPLIGLFILLIWGIHDMFTWRRHGTAVLSVAAVLAVSVCFALTRQQLAYWRDSESLFRHALNVTQNNYLSHNNLGSALGKKGQLDEAISQFGEAIRLKPAYASAHNNLGNALFLKGQPQEAIQQYREAARLKPNYAEAHYNLGSVLDQEGRIEEAIGEYRQAIRLKADYARAYNNLGSALFRKGRLADAIRQYQEAIRHAPDDTKTHYNLGLALDQQGRADEAIREYQEALRLEPDDANTHYNLGVVFSKKGHAEEAIVEYREAIRLKPGNAGAHYNLANALAREGRIAEAIQQYREALRLKPDYEDARINLEAVLATQADSPKQPGATIQP